MKLFQRLLVAPAALGLLAPVVANANEVNLNEIANYSDIESIEIKSFDNDESNLNPLLAGGEGLMDDQDLGSEDSFSTTTTMDGSASFLIGAADNGPTETVQSSYVWDIDLDTSFTGDDKLEVGIAAGNTGADVGRGDALDFGEATADAVKVIDLNYTFPVGENITMQVGDSLKISKQFTSACTYSNLVDVLGDCGDSGAHGVSGDVTATGSYDFGNGFALAAGVAGDGGTNGIMTKAASDDFGVNGSYTSDTFGISVAYANSETSTKSYADGTGTPEYLPNTSYYGVHTSYTPEELPVSFSAGYGIASPEGTTVQSSQWMLGATVDELGPGALGVGMGTQGAIAQGAEEKQVYEVHYTYPINDGMEAQFGYYILENAGVADSETGVVATTTFSF